MDSPSTTFVSQLMMLLWLSLTLLGKRIAYPSGDPVTPNLFNFNSFLFFGCLIIFCSFFSYLCKFLLQSRRTSAQHSKTSTNIQCIFESFGPVDVSPLLSSSASCYKFGDLIEECCVCSLQALGFSMPYFAHVSLILAPDRSKLSKRHGATSVGQVGFFGSA